MHPYHMDWFLKEEQKRKDNRKEGEIERLNLQFKRLIEPLSYELDQANYTEEERVFNRKLVSCSIWRLGYRNNYTNPDVLVLQAGWLLLILKKEAGNGSLKDEHHLKQETSRLIHHIRNVDMSAYQRVLQNHPDVRFIL